MRNIKSMKKTLSVFLAGILLSACLPVTALAAITDQYEVEISGTSASAEVPETLENGKVWTDRTVSAVDGSSTQLDVSLSALGQKYPSTETTSVPTVTVLVLDTSGSMNDDMVNNDGENYSRMDALKDAAGNFVDSVVPAGGGGTNYVAVVTYASNAYQDLQFTNSNTALQNEINGLYANGGTNTHGGLIAAYKMINNPTSYGLSASQISNAVYSVVFMSDGEPSYYYYLRYSTWSGSSYIPINSAEVYDNFSFSSTSGVLTKGSYGSSYTLGYTGPGDDSNDNTVGNAIAAANILKTNGVKPTVYSVYLYNDGYTDAESTMNAIASSVDTTYTPGDANTLNGVFQKIAVSIKNVACTPIAETTQNNILAESSYVKIQDTIGDAYSLSGSVMTVTYQGADCAFTGDGDGTYTYTGTEFPELEKVVVTAENSGGNMLVTLKIPASVLPCSLPNASETVNPIVLTYRIELSEDGITGAGTYPTSSGCTVTFTPTSDNPYYYPDSSASGETYTTATFQTVKDYKATYDENSSSSATLTSFGYGDQGSSLTYLASPGSQSATYSSPSLTTTYDGADVTFPSHTAYSATASFSAAALPSSAAGNFSVASLNVMTAAPEGVDSDYQFSVGGTASVFSAALASTSSGAASTSSFLDTAHAQTGNPVTTSQTNSDGSTTYTVSTTTTTPYTETTTTTTTYYYDLTVKYGNNKYILFEDVPFVSTTQTTNTYQQVAVSSYTYNSLPVTLITEDYSSPSKNETGYSTTYSTDEDDYSSINSISYNSGTHTYTVVIKTGNGNSTKYYTVSGVTFSSGTYFDYVYYTFFGLFKHTIRYYTWSGTGTTDPSDVSSSTDNISLSSSSQTGISNGSKTASYYFASGSSTTGTVFPDYLLTYSAGPAALAVSYGRLADGTYQNNVSYTADADNSDGVTTSITKATGTDQTVYTVTVTDTNEGTQTVYRYTEDTSGDPAQLLIQHSTRSLDEIPDGEGVVSMNLSGSGSIKLTSNLTADDYIPGASVKLTSPAGLDYTTATSQGVAYVVLTFTVSDKAPVSIRGIILGSDDECSITTVDQIPTSYLGAGTYQITYQIQTTYNINDMPSSINVYFEQLSFTTTGLNNLIINCNTNHENQQVTVYLVSPAGH